MAFSPGFEDRPSASSRIFPGREPTELLTLSPCRCFRKKGPSLGDFLNPATPARPDAGTVPVALLTTDILTVAVVADLVNRHRRSYPPCVQDWHSQFQEKRCVRRNPSDIRGNILLWKTNIHSASIKKFSRPAGTEELRRHCRCPRDGEAVSEVPGGTISVNCFMRVMRDVSIHLRGGGRSVLPACKYSVIRGAVAKCHCERRGPHLRWSVFPRHDRQDACPTGRSLQPARGRLSSWWDRRLACLFTNWSTTIRWEKSLAPCN